MALALALTASAWALQSLPPEGTPIVGVEVRGTQRTQADHVLRVMELKAGSAFSRTALRRDQQKIADLGDYNPLAIKISSEDTPTGVRLIVEVQENETIKRILFVGNIKYTTERLTRELDYKEGEILPLAAKESTARNIRNFYAKGGYKNAGVRVAVDPSGDGSSVLVTIIIDEGEKIRVRDLLIEGNRHFSAIRIRGWAVNSGSWLFFDNYYDDRAFDDDLRVIAEKYRDAGFLDATTRRGEFIYDEKKAWVSPVIVINEGPRYKIRDVQVKGNTLFTATEVRKPFLPLMGETYDGYKVSQAVKALARIYGDQGYVNARFDTDFEKDPKRGEVVIKIAATEGNVVYVGKVDVVVKTQDYDLDLKPLEKFVDWTSPGLKHETIAREVKLKPGAKYRTADEVRTVDRIRRLGFIEDVHVDRKPTSDPNVSDVAISVDEDPNAGYVSVTAGVGEESGATVGANYVNPNLFGEGRVLRLGASIGTRSNSFSAGYLDRHFMDSDVSFEQTLFRSYARYDGYAQRIYGSATEFGYPLNDDVRVYGRVRLERVNLIRRDQSLVEDMHSYGVYALRGMIARDMRNDRRWTTKGYYVTGGVEPGFARNGMLKLTHSLEWYTALSRNEDWVYAYGHNVGVQPYHARRIGLTERFFVGGTSSLRGFQPRGIGPTDRGERDVHIGGTTMLTQRHELRYRFSRMVQGRLFTDIGMLDDSPLNIDHPRVGSGAGVTFDLGALSLDLDLAAPVVRYRYDRTRWLHFRLRSNF